MKCSVTYEELAAFAAQEPGSDDLGRHVHACGECRKRLAALRDVDGALQRIVKEGPPARGVLNTWRAVLEESRGGRCDEVMTLDDVATFLKLSLDDLEDVASDLPTFEVAGRVRLRRAKLMEWIEDRERRHRRSIAASETARGFSGLLRSRSWATRIG